MLFRSWLDAHHPEQFPIGNMLWRGRIYSPLPFVKSLTGTRINAGVWGTAAFPSVYSTDVHPAQFLPHSPGWMIGATGALVASALFAVFSPYVGLAAALLLLGLLAWGTTIGRCLHFAWRSDLNAIAATSQPSRMRHRAVIAWLHLIQPIARIYGQIGRAHV